jgi:hypothetical protein
MTLPNGLDSRLVKDISLVVSRMYEHITPEDEDCEGYVVSFVRTKLNYLLRLDPKCCEAFKCQPRL